ncbi:unnamed protein product [Umbelopsis ramanniana]
MTILEAVNWKKFLQQKHITEEIQQLIFNIIRKPPSYRALEKSLNCFCFFETSRELFKVSKVALGFLLYARSNLLTRRPILQFFETVISTSSIELQVELLYVLKKLLLKEYENGSDNDLQQTGNFTNWSAQREVKRNHNPISAIVQTYFKNITDFAFVNDVAMQAAVVSVMTDIVRQGLVPPSKCLPVIVSLSTSPLLPIQRRSSCLLESMLTRNINLLQYREPELIKSIWAYHKGIDGRSLQSGIQKTDQSHFEHIARYYRKSKNGFHRFMSAIISLFEWNGAHDVEHSEKLHELQRCIYLVNNVTMIDYVSVNEIQMVLTFTERRICELETESAFETTIIFDDQDSFKFFNNLMMGLLLKIIRSSLKFNPLVEKSITSDKKKHLYDPKRTPISPQDLLKIINATIEDACNGRWCQELFDQAMSLHRSNSIGEGSKPQKGDPVSSSSSLQGRKGSDRHCKKRRS